MSVAGNIEVINPLVRRVFTNTAENDMAIFVDSPGQSIHLGCNSNATVPSTVMITQSNLVLNGDIMFPNRVIAMSRLRVTQPDNLMIPANISTSYSSVPGVNPSNGSNFDLSLGVTVSNFRFLQTSTGNICASLGFDGSLRINNLLTSNIIRLNSNGALSNITGLTMSNGQILGSLNDSAGSPGFAWNGDTGTGIFHLGTGQVGVSVGSTQVASFSNGGVSVTGTVDATTLRQGGTGVILTTGGTITGTLNAQTLQQANISVLTTNGGTVNGTLNAQTLQQAGNDISTMFAPSNHIHNVTTSSITGILPVGKGGTGVSTLTANKLLLGNGTNVVSAVDSLHWTGSYLGINTPSPSSTLHVNGDINVTSGGTISGSLTVDSYLYRPNIIAFRATLTTAQLLVLNTLTVVKFNTTTFNKGSCFNTTTFRFTAPVAGLYHVMTQVNRSTTTYTDFASVSILLNGAVYSTVETTYSKASTYTYSPTMVMSDVMSLSANDYVQIACNPPYSSTDYVKISSVFSIVFIG